MITQTRLTSVGILTGSWTYTQGETEMPKRRRRNWKGVPGREGRGHRIKAWCIKERICATALYERKEWLASLDKGKPTKSPVS